MAPAYVGRALPVNPLCQHCQQEIARRQLHHCPDCHTAFHIGCWQEHDGCSNRDCSQASLVEAQAEPEPISPVQPEAAKAPTGTRRLGVLVSVGPEHPGFVHALRLAQAAMEAQVEVYYYCLDDAVKGLGDPALQQLRAHGLRLFGCAFSAQRRRIATGDEALYGGLTMLSDIIARTHRFVSFN